MAQYEKVFTKPYEDGYEDLPSQNTPITASTLNDKDTAIEHIEDFLDGQEFPTAEEKAVWNDAQNLYKYTLLDQVAQINSNVSGVVPAIAMDDYSIGDYFVQQKKLCKAIAAISNGDDLIKNTNYVEVTVGDELRLKADISAIGTDESGRTTASKAYAIGKHFYKDGKFCTAKTAIASGGTFTLNTNYVEDDVADKVFNTEKIMSVKKGELLLFEPIWANNKAWPGSSLEFTIPQNNGRLYHFVAMTTTGSLVDYYFTNRTNGVTSVKSGGNETATFSYSDDKLTINFSISNYWLYKLEVIKQDAE